MDPARTIVLTGGGTAGHVIPNLALLPLLSAAGWRAEYVGSEAGIEKKLVAEAGLPFHGIASGKLRRYFDRKNFSDPFRIVLGLWQAWRILGRVRPKLVFSKGGFVAVPVVLAARLRGIPVVIHESDLTPGLANRMAIPFARAVCVSFRETLRHLPKDKAVQTGAPIRAELFQGSREKGEAFLGLTAHEADAQGAVAPGAGGQSAGADRRPLLLIIGGSLGSRNLNAAVRAALPGLLARYRIAHLCGKGGIDPALQGRPGYRQLEYVSAEMPDVLAAADLVLSRAGSNAIFEFLALRKPNLLVPLPLTASRGDQILNARAFEAEGFSRVLAEEDIVPGRLEQELALLEAQAEIYREAMRASPVRDGARHVMDVIARWA
ncbi:MAG: undecaprenyldiphospho-muramoylpentapeptide beta-N-acetylglucosaminyltransferase [Fibrobacteres bacterium]|nr:undecaprenyldiphospho-muramoylpentapeptide beta-N-acetylglucosaminyltransferase [Fibrobacterota bacterium]